jgi:hypothetical protein
LGDVVLTEEKATIAFSGAQNTEECNRHVQKDRTRKLQQEQIRQPALMSALLQRAPRPRFGGWCWLRGAWPVLLILVLPVLLLRHSLFGGGATTGADILAQQPPWSVDLAGQVSQPQNPALFDEPFEISAWFLFARQELLSGRFPFWNPYVAGGTPFLAAGQPAVLYPLTLLGVLLPYPFSMTFMSLLKWWLAGLGMYVFARSSLRLGQVAGLTAALSYMFSSFIVVWLIHIVGSAAMLLPWALWASERVIHAPGRKRLALLAVIAALVAFSGHPEMTFHVLLGASLYALWLIGSWRGHNFQTRLRRMALWVGGMALGVALAAVQLLPFITRLPQTLGTVIRSDNYSGIAIPLQGALTWLVPNLWGNLAINHAYWGPRNYNEEVWYAGVVALALAGVALLALRQRERRAEIGFFALLVVVFAGMLYRIPPFIWLTRLPVLDVDSWTRLGVLALLGVAALAGFGVEELLAWKRSVPAARSAASLPTSKLPSTGERNRLHQLLARRGLLAPAGLLLALPGLLWAIGRFWRPPHLNPTQTAWEVLWIRFAVVLLWCTVLVMLARWRGWLNRRTIAGLLLVLLLCDQLVFAAPYTPQPASILAYPQTPTITRIQQTVGSARMAASNTLLEPDSLAPYHLRDIRAYDPTVSSRYVHFMLVTDPGLGQTNAYCCQFLDCPSAVLLGVASVEYYATLPDEDPSRCVKLAPGQVAASGPYLPLWTQGGLTLWRNSLARPRFYFAGHVLSVPSEQADIAALPTLGAGTLDAAIEGATAMPPGEILDKDTLTASTDLPGEIELHTLSEAPRWVVINESYDPGWQANLDGAAVAIHPANVMFQAVLVPAGAHTLHLLYRPTGYVPGLVISLVALLSLLGLLASEWVMRLLQTMVRGRRES